jgi:tRNA1(Val) A37 N6-methylase TrmN6
VKLDLCKVKPLVSAPRSPASAATTIDAFLGGRLMMEQPVGGYRAGLDAVLLAASVGAAGGPRVLDLGAGVGVAGLCAAVRLPDADLTLVELQPVLAALAGANIRRNGLDGRARVIAGDVTGGGLGLASDGFDTVMSNPPFDTEGRGRASANDLKARSHAMPAGHLDLWVRAMARYYCPGGTASMIHRADALGAVLAAFGRRFGGVTVRPVHPREGEAAVRIVVQGVKGSRAPLSLLPGLILHEPGGHGFRPEVQAVLRDGAALS